MRNKMDTPTNRFTPYQSRYTAYLRDLSRNSAYEGGRIPGRTQGDRRMVQENFKHVFSKEKKRGDESS